MTGEKENRLYTPNRSATSTKPSALDEMKMELRMHPKKNKIMINRKRRCRICENENLVIPKGSRRCGESVNGCYLLWMPSLSLDVPIQEETKSEKMDGIGLQSDEPNRRYETE
ncbi:hypothetical protein L1887_00924 [Cichorium endivia]|nr:hypothetical protein L1887_00924 [Cichorium endivia]